MPPIIDNEGDKVGYEVTNSNNQLWKFSKSIAWNDKNKDFPPWVNFNNIQFFEVVIDNNQITKDTEKLVSFFINLYDDVNGIYNPRTYTLVLGNIFILDVLDIHVINSGDNQLSMVTEIKLEPFVRDRTCIDDGCK